MWDPLQTGMSGGWAKVLAKANERQLATIASNWRERLEAIDPQVAPRLDLSMALKSVMSASHALLSGRVEECRQTLLALCATIGWALGAFDFYSLIGPAGHLEGPSST